MQGKPLISAILNAFILKICVGLRGSHGLSSRNTKTQSDTTTFDVVRSLVSFVALSPPVKEKTDKGRWMEIVRNRSQVVDRLDSLFVIKTCQTKTEIGVNKKIVVE